MDEFMMPSKEEQLKKLDSAYQRLIISSGGYETEEFTKILNKESKEGRRVRIAEFIKSYQGHSLFISYDSLRAYYDAKQIMRILLGDLEETKTELYLYLFSSESELGNLKEALDIIYEHSKAWIEYISGSYGDDGYVIEIRDNRCFAANSYLKIYPNGQVLLVSDSDYRIEKMDLSLTADLSAELNAEVEKKVTNIIAEKKYLICDDREFLRSFVVSYGFEWLGYKHDMGMDYQDYFLEKYPLKVIEKIMKISTIKEKFIDSTMPER